MGFKVSTNFNKVTKVDVIIICVPTPLTPQNELDISYVKSTKTSDFQFHFKSFLYLTCYFKFDNKTTNLYK